MTSATKVSKGAAWMLLFKSLERSLSLISVVILARLLIPADFGLVAMAVSVIALVEIVSTFNFELAIIQRTNPTREHYDSAWTMNILAGMGGALVTASAALPAADFYNEPRLTHVMLVLAAAWLIQGFENIGTVNFRREMNFSLEFRFMFAKKLGGFLVTLALAFTFRSYWALILGTLFSRVLGVTLSYMLQPFRPRFSLVARRDLMTFSGWIMANGLLYFLTTRLSHLVIGRLNGASGLGLFTVASEIANVPSTELVAPINRALFPAFARMAEGTGGLKRGLLGALSVMTLLALPACIGLAAVADPLVHVLLGNKWTGAAPVVALLAFAGIVPMLTSPNYLAYLALARTHIPVYIGIWQAVSLISFLFVFAGEGAIGVAKAQLISSIIVLAPSVWYMYRLLDVHMAELWRAVWRPFVASAAMWVVVTAATEPLTEHVGATAYVTQLAVLVPLGFVTYVVLAVGLWLIAGRPPGAETYVLDIARRASSRLAFPSAQAAPRK
jgi:lipopolysaccharide exporter